MSKELENVDVSTLTGAERLSALKGVFDNMQKIIDSKHPSKHALIKKIVEQFTKGDEKNIFDYY